MPILTSTLAIAGIGTTFTNVKRIIPKSIFFISLPPYSHHIDFYLYYSIPEQFLKIILTAYYRAEEQERHGSLYLLKLNTQDNKTERRSPCLRRIITSR
jgi:hypothetical protein